MKKKNKEILNPDQNVSNFTNGSQKEVKIRQKNMKPYINLHMRSIENVPKFL